MKTKLLLVLLIVSTLASMAQVSFVEGPEITGILNSYVNRTIQGDDASFYTYRVKTKGGGFSYYIEKYDKTTMKQLFSKEIKSEQSQYVDIENVLYSADNVYIFTSQFYKEKGVVSLSYTSVSSEGVVVAENQELISIKSVDKELVDLELFQNPKKTNFLIKASYTASEKEPYKTDFVLIEAKSMRKLFSKQVDKNLSSELYLRTSASTKVPIKNNNFYDLLIDDDYTIYYAYSDIARTVSNKNYYKLCFDIISSNSEKEESVLLDWDENNYVEDLKFGKNEKNEIVLGGFYKSHEMLDGYDMLRLGVFNFTLRLSSASVKNKEFKLFDDAFLNSLRINAKLSHFFKYKMDYLYFVGDDVYFIGEQYVRGPYGVTSNNPDSPFVNPNSADQTFYNYSDVLVAKLNANGKWEWVKNIPVRMKFDQMDPHISNQYIAYASTKNIYILYNDKKNNLKVLDKPVVEFEHLGNTSKAKGSNFVCTEMSLNDGAVKRSLVFVNENYSFDPIPTLDYTGPFPGYSERKQYYSPIGTSLFVCGSKSEIYIHTQSSLKGRFVKLHFE